MLQINFWSLMRELQQRVTKHGLSNAAINTCTDAGPAASPFSIRFTSLLASTGEVLFT